MHEGSTAISGNNIFECLTLTIVDGIAEIRLMRPTLLNRFDQVAHKEFIDALGTVGADPSNRALIISAEGKVFSAGGDFNEMFELHRSAAFRDQLSDDARGIYNGLVNVPIPVIAAVQGAAVGLGATIATLSDIVVAWRGAKIADTHVHVGIAAGDGGIISWSQSIGLNRAKRYLLTGDPITAEQGYQFGLVTDLVDSPEEVLPQARAIAERIKALPPGGVNGTKRAFAELTRLRTAEVFELGLGLEMESFTSPDVPATLTKILGR